MQSRYTSWQVYAGQLRSNNVTAQFVLLEWLLLYCGVSLTSLQCYVVYEDKLGLLKGF